MTAARTGCGEDEKMVFHHGDALVSLQCSSCNETYKRPYVLSCLHSFCFHCITKLRRTEQEDIIQCPSCEQESNFKDGTVLPNYFFTNITAANVLKDIRDRGMCCGNCTTGNPPSVFCEECHEYLCNECVYCHENTKLTRNHCLVPRQTHETRLSMSGHDRAVFCRVHNECTVEQYCVPCGEPTCDGCDLHTDHTMSSVSEAYAIEIPGFKEILEKATRKVDKHEKCASQCCNMIDQLRVCKGELSEKIKASFAASRERMEKYEQKLLETVLSWYDRKFEMIKQAQQEEERKLEKINNVLKFSHAVLCHGTDKEILSLKKLIQSQLNRVMALSTGEKFITAVHDAIQNASWDDTKQNQDHDSCSQEGLKLPEVGQAHFDFAEVESTEAEKRISENSVDELDEKEKITETANGSLRSEKVYKDRIKYGVEGHDYLVGSVIPGGKSKLWRSLRQRLVQGMARETRQVGRDYRYDKIMRNKTIGRQGTGCGEFHHPCDIAVDRQRNDRLIVTDYNNDRVQVFNYFGEFLFAFGARGSKASQFMGPTGVAVLHNGSIVVSDCLNNRMQLFTSQGKYISSFGEEGRSFGQFWRPMGVAVDSMGRIIVVDQGNNRIQVFDSNGDFCFAFGKLGHWDGEVSCPNFVAVDKDDNIYVSDEVNLRIQIFDRNGAFVRKISSQEVHGFQGNMKLLSGIAVDYRGHVLVSGKNCCSVNVFTADGRFVRTFSSKHTRQSRLQFASGIALTSAGEIVVSDWINNRIRFF